ncbi:hypothetical protein BgiMline_032435, partial [Biomphalaria glabrata]
MTRKCLREMFGHRSKNTSANIRYCSGFCLRPSARRGTAVHWSNTSVPLFTQLTRRTR